MKKDKRFRQGIFNPTNPKKYVGKNNPIYRSGWELKFFRWADLNENILAWGSENIVIPYLNPLDGKVHRYFVDNYIVFCFLYFVFTGLIVCLLGFISIKNLFLFPFLSLKTI